MEGDPTEVRQEVALRRVGAERSLDDPFRKRQPLQFARELRSLCKRLHPQDGRARGQAGREVGQGAQHPLERRGAEEDLALAALDHRLLLVVAALLDLALLDALFSLRLLRLRGVALLLLLDEAVPQGPVLGGDRQVQAGVPEILGQSGECRELLGVFLDGTRFEGAEDGRGGFARGVTLEDARSEHEKFGGLSRGFWCNRRRSRRRRRR